MRITVSGILTDYQGRPLLQQSGPRTLEPVHRPLSPDDLAPVMLARAFREDTALIVLPVRLTGLYYDGRESGALTFCYRCTMRGGDLSVPEGRPPAGFFELPLPRALAGEYREQVDQALHHAGGPPALVEHGGLRGRIGRLFEHRAGDDAAAAWDVTVRLVDEAAEGPVEWTRPIPHERAEGVDAPVMAGVAPWQAAAQLLAARKPPGPAAVRLVGVQMVEGAPALTLVFAPVESDRGGELT